MKIFALYAAKNKGKTATLNKLIDLFVSVADRYEINREYETNAYFVVNGKGITVCTAGDNNDIISENLDFLKKHDTEVFVSASRTRGGTVEGLSEFAEKFKAELVWIEKTEGESNYNLVASGLVSLKAAI